MAINLLMLRRQCLAPPQHPHTAALQSVQYNGHMPRIPEPLPAVDDTLLQITGEDYARYLIERLRSRGFLDK